MTDLRARLADALINRLADHNYPLSRDTAADLAAALMAVPGIAIVEAPEGSVRDSEITRWSTPVGQVTRWRGLVQHSHGSTWRPDEAREYAAALLAAANVAETTSEVS